ncbi:sodium:solute symporter [Verrucomicrobia bacterium IMCC26134]|nr:sodium:solute symporter [Verrucomicrobia bacterium IMCC26134]
MSGSLSPLDLAVLVAYLLGVVGCGCWFYRRAGDSEQYMSAGRSLPGWAVGLSIFGSYVSSISFLANPGKSFAGDWGGFVFALSLPVAALVAVKWFVPFFRERGEISAYGHLEARFGAWARSYAVVCYLLTQVARLGTILYLLALALVPLTGWDIRTIILGVGLIIVIYPLIGGTEAVIWTGVAQALVLVAGALVCILSLMFKMPEGPVQIIEIGAANHKFELGSFAGTLARPTFWVVLVYGLVINLQNFGIDQSYVQRYITAKSDAAARSSVWMGSLLYIPFAAGFFFIGTALYAFYQVQPGLLPAAVDAVGKPDSVFPAYISTQLPAGLAGLVVAALCAAAMDSNLNCMATLFHGDFYTRYLRPKPSERESMRVLHGSTIGFGLICIGAALAMIEIKSALDVWWELAGVFGGGMLGLFLLGRLFPRAGRTAGLAGVGVGILVILWMTLSPKLVWWPESLRSPFNGLLVIVFGTFTILVVGGLTALIFPTRAKLSSPPLSC